jgi:hypothetical protein
MNLAGKLTPWLAIGAGAVTTADKARQRVEGGESWYDAIGNTIQNNLLDLGGMGPGALKNNPRIQEAVEAFRPPPMPENTSPSALGNFASRFTPAGSTAKAATPTPTPTPTPEPPGFVLNRTVSPVDNQFPQRPEAVAAMNRPVTTAYTPTGPVTRGSSEPPKPMEVVDYRTPQGTASGARVAGRGQGGFVGAATDAEAMRNQQSRMTQDAAASANAQSMLRAANTMEENRMTRRGMEGGIGGGVVGKAGESFGDDVLDRDRYLRQFQPDANTGGRSRRAMQANLITAQQAYDTVRQARDLPLATDRPAINPIDAQRFLLDQQKFGWQQGVDKGRLTLEQAKAQNEAAATNLNQSKADNERRNAFIQEFSLSDSNAPREELAASAWEISKATGGVVPPEAVKGYIEKEGIDWKNGPPESLKKFSERIMAKITADYQGK